MGHGGFGRAWKQAKVGAVKLRGERRSAREQRETSGFAAQ